MALADGRASASQVIEPLAIHRPKAHERILDDIAIMEKLQTASGIRGAMYYHVKVNGTAGDGERIKAIVEEALARAENVFSLWIEGSEVNKINKAPRGEVIELSNDMSEVLKAVDRLYTITKGIYDPACYPLMQFYKHHLLDTMRGLDFFSAEKDPQQAAIAAYAHWSVFLLSKDGKTLTKMHEKAGLDLGGIAKGWAIDLCVERLKSAGFTDIYMEWGGDVRVEGKHPTGRLWTVNIAEPPTLAQLRAAPLANQKPVDTGMGGNPHTHSNNKAILKSMASLSLEDNTEFLACISLRSGSSITTSGDYMQVFWFGDKLFHHVFQAKTKKLMEVSSTTIAQSSVILVGACMYADALATATLAMGVGKDAKKFLDTLTAVPVEDYLMYVREGPRVIRRKIRGSESELAREVRMAQHDPANVVVIGGGLAGFSAVIEAARCGATVTLLEKEMRLGGNSAKATSGINAWGSRPQAEQGVSDEERYFERDTFRSSKGGLCDPSLVRLLSTQSAEAIRWLMDDIGVDLNELSQLGGHARKRTHRARPTASGDPRPIGWCIMEAVQLYVKERLAGQVTIITGAKVINLNVELSHEGGKKAIIPPRKTVTGVIYEDITTGITHSINADSVVLCTGGYGCDFSSTSLLKAHRPDLVANDKGDVGMPSTNGAFATGDGVKIGTSIGAETVDMDKVQLHPTSFVDPKDPTNPTKILGPEALRGSGGILINQEGRRFCNELDLRSKVSSAILNNCQPFPLPGGQPGNIYAWCVMNEEAQKKFGLPSLRFYKDIKGLFESAPDFPSLARDVIGCDSETLKQAIEEYGVATDMQVDVKTQKNVFPARFSWEDKNLVAARVTPSIHYTMGGLRISAATEVLENARTDRAPTLYYRKLRPIRRLFAAGEVTGGVHGENRLGGNSLLECVVFGRMAGERAATIKSRSETCLSTNEWTPVTFREILKTDESHGINTMVFRFHLHSALQKAGLDVGQFVAIRGEAEGEILQGFYSPINRPNEQGTIEILCRTDVAGGQIVRWLNEVRPGGECYLKAMGGLRLKFSIVDGRRIMTHEGRKIKQLSLLAGGTGIAPMIQILRAYLYYLVGEGAPADAPLPDPSESGVKLVYAAERDYDLAFQTMLEMTEERHPEHFSSYIVLNQPPLGWTEGVGFVDDDTIKKYLFFPSSENALTVICGPPIFEKMMCEKLAKLNFPRSSYFAYSQV